MITALDTWYQKEAKTVLYGRLLDGSRQSKSIQEYFLNIKLEDQVNMRRKRKKKTNKNKERKLKQKKKKNKKEKL